MATCFDRPPQSRTFQWAAALLALVAGCSLASAEASPIPSGTVSLEEALAAVLLRSPDLAAYPFEVRAREARALQEGLSPNPTLTTELENFGRFGGGGPGVERAQSTISLVQLVQLGGKREQRAALAALDGRLAEWDYERARSDAAAKTLRAFVAGLLAQERAALAEELLALAREVVAAARKQVAAGATSPTEVTRTEAALAEVEVLRGRRERELQAARVALATLWGDPAPVFRAFAGHLGPVAPPRPLDALRAEVQRNPDVARWKTSIERAQASVTLEEAQRMPDLTVRVGSRRFLSAETNAFVAEVAVPLPLFDRNQGAIQEAYDHLDKTRAEQQAAIASVEGAMAAAHEELLAAYDQANELEQGVVPRLRSALDGARRGYAAGALRYLDVLDAQRGLVEARGAHVEAVGRYHTAATTLERLTGGPVTATAGRTP